MNLDYQSVWNTIVQLQLLGVIVGLVLGFIAEIFIQKSAEERKEKRKFLESFSNIIIEAKDNGWLEWPEIGEYEFQLLCSKLQRYNKNLGLSFKLYYYDLWTFASTGAYVPGKKRTDEEKELRDGCIEDLEKMTYEFHNYYLGNKKRRQGIKNFIGRTVLMLQSLNPFRQKADLDKDKSYQKAVRIGKSVVKTRKKSAQENPY